MIGKNLIKNLITWFLISCLCICSSGVFSACTKAQPPVVKQGVEVSDDANYQYADSTFIMAEDAISGVVESVYKKRLNKNQLSESEVGEVKETARSIRVAFSVPNVSEQAFIDFFSSIKDSSESYATMIFNLYKADGTKEDSDLLKGALSALSSLFGADATANVIYNLAVYNFELKKQEALDKYDKYGYDYLIKDAEKYEQDKRVLTEDITLNSFIPAVKFFFFTSELFFGGAFDSQMIGSFSDSELLLLVKTPDFSQLEMSVDGWRLILDGAISMASLTAYQKKLKSTAEKNGDLDKIAGTLTDAVRLFNSVQEKLDVDAVNLLKNQEKDSFVSKCFSLLSQSDWDVFERITSVELSRSEYDSAALDYFGSDYSNYLNGVNAVSLSQLKNAIATDEFNQTLNEYFIGICPAFWFGV